VERTGPFLRRCKEGSRLKKKNKTRANSAFWLVLQESRMWPTCITLSNRQRRGGRREGGLTYTTGISETSRCRVGMADPLLPTRMILENAGIGIEARVLRITSYVHEICTTQLFTKILYSVLSINVEKKVSATPS
jgi:hypothetical protein